MDRFALSKHLDAIDATPGVYHGESKNGNPVLVIINKYLGYDERHLKAQVYALPGPHGSMECAGALQCYWWIGTPAAEHYRGWYTITHELI